MAYELVDLVGHFAVVVTVMVNCTGILTCRKIMVDGSVGVATHVPFVAGVIMCVLWTMYGIFIEDSSIKTVNMIGLILYVFYCIIYILYDDKNTNIRRDAVVAITGLLVAIAYFFVIASRGDSTTTLLGIICNIATIMFFAAPLSTMSQVVKAQSTASMSLPLSVMSLIVTASWVMYGMLITDALVIFPNALGLLLALMQLSLFYKYRGTTEKSNIIV